MAASPRRPYLHLLLFLLLASISTSSASPPSINPFSPRASLLRRWARLFPPSTPIPSFLLARSSPLNASQLATFACHLDGRTLRSHLRPFCAAANLFCPLPDPSAAAVEGEPTTTKHRSKDMDSFKTYSPGRNVGMDRFSTYGKGESGRSVHFSSYAWRSNVGRSGFSNYAAAANGVAANFANYGPEGNIQRHDFKGYGRDGSGGHNRFSSYSESSNTVKNSFSTYSSGANSAVSDFSAYSNSSNVATNAFKSYDTNSNGGSGLFTGYSGTVNIAKNAFAIYNTGANGGTEEFSAYGDDKAGLPETTFTTYGHRTNDPSQKFSSYGNSTSPSRTEFADYNKDASGSANALFLTYFRSTDGSNVTNFRNYFRTITTFEDYKNSTPHTPSPSGRFFRRLTLTAGNRIRFPDIRDKMPQRSFLPRELSIRFPWKVSVLSEIFGKSLEDVMGRTIAECKRPAVKDELKRCVTSIEGMAEFTAQVLGRTAKAAWTASTGGWGRTVTVKRAEARGGGDDREGGRVVSCHQSLFPYLVYYCHMVPRVIVYDVDLMEGEVEVNRAMAVCHMDTSQWGAGHVAFAELGGRPGKIEVCHFIYENDLVWTMHK